jgi:uncharacterized protein (DUF2236 family)
MVQDHGYFGPTSATWKIGSEAIVTLGGARAVLMQLAHPLVAQAVHTHSSYMHNPFGRAERTFLMSQMLAFGSTPTSRQGARIINRLHTHVQGTLPASAGDYAKGSPYFARDPDLLLWVHATVVDTVLLFYPLFVAPLSQEEQEQYYQESKVIAHLLGLTASNMPKTVNDLHIYIHDMVHSNHLAATPQARELARQVLFPAGPPVLRLFCYFSLGITCALLPSPIRDIYGLEWDNKQQIIFELLMCGMRMTIPYLPTKLRIFPITRTMMQKGYLTDSLLDKVSAV